MEIFIPTESIQGIIENGVPLIEQNIIPCIIIFGGLASGKTKLLHSLSKLKNTIYIDCFRFRDNLKSFYDCIQEPNSNFFLFDNFDIVCPDFQEPIPLCQKLASSAIIATILRNKLKFIATTSSLSQLNRLFFTEIDSITIELSHPNLEERRTYFRQALTNLHSSFNISSLSSRIHTLSMMTQGFSFGDLSRLLNSSLIDLYASSPPPASDSPFCHISSPVSLCEALERSLSLRLVEPLLPSTLQDSLAPTQFDNTPPDFVGYDDIVKRLTRTVLRATAASFTSSSSSSSSRPLDALLSLHSLPPVSGLLIHGPPGSGKTSLARTLAYKGRKLFKFLDVPCADLVRKVVGEAEARVAELFTTARKLAPCFILLDNIEILLGMNPGGARGRSGGRTDHQALDRVLSQLLTEIDGVQSRTDPSNPPVIVIATTSFPTSIDRSLLRPGRLEEHVSLSLPDRDQRRCILNYYLIQRFPFIRSHLHSIFNESSLETAFSLSLSSLPGLGLRATQLLDRLTQVSEGRSSVELKQWMEEAAWGLVRDLFQAKSEGREMVDWSDEEALGRFLDSLEKTPTLSCTDMRER